MNNLLKRITAAVGALVISGALAVSAAAEDYGQAGIEWMIKDCWWEHRNTVGGDVLNEMEDDFITCHMEDVNITGNGEYTVLLSGWCVEEEDRNVAEVGNLGVAITTDIEQYPDLKMTLTKAVIDNVEYTFNEQPEFEENNGGDDHIMKLKNPWGEPAKTTPEMDNKCWETTDPITITFTVEGLPEDKTEDNPDEIISYDYEAQNPIEPLPEETEESEAEAESIAAEAAEEAVSAEAPAETDEDNEEKSGVSAGLIAGIAAAVVVIGAVVVIFIKKK